MSLGDILDDIQSDVSNIETPENGGIATENVVIMDAKRNGQQFSVQRFSKETLDKVNNMFNLLTLKKNIAGLPRVDRGIALEMFTMLPEAGRVEQAKLTSAPSIINKEIMDKVFNANIEHKLSLDVTDKLYDLRDLIENHLPMVELINNYLQAFNSTVETKAEVFKNAPPTVVEYKAYEAEENKPDTRMVDLYKEKMDVILHMDDSKMEYEKYNGKLIALFDAVYYDQTLTDLYNTAVYLPVKSELTLDSIVQVGKSTVENVNRYKQDLERYISGLNAVQRQETELNSETIEFINGYEEMAMKLETIGRLKAIIETKDNVFERTATLIEFID